MNFSKSRLGVWTIWIVASLFYAYQYVLRVMPNVMLNDILEKFQIDTTTFGQFSGVYYLGYSLMHLPVGVMLDRYGPRKVMSGCMLLTVLGLLPLAVTNHWLFSILGRFMIGLGSSAAILGVFKIIRMTFKEERFPRMLSFSVMIGLVGAIYGGGPVDYMLKTFGYDTVIYVFAALGALLTLTTYWIIPNTKPTITSTVFSNVIEVLKTPQVLLGCLFAGLMVAPLEGFADVWATAFLKNVCGLDGNLSASLPSIIFIGMCFGSPLLSFIGDKVGNYLGTVVGAGIAMAVSFILLLASPQSHLSISLNFVVVGIACAYQILAIYKISTYVREQIAGLTTAIANMIIMVFGYVFHTIMGKVIDQTGGASSPDAVVYGISVIPVALCIGTVGYLFMMFHERRAAKTA